MTAVGGSIQECSVSGRGFAVSGDSDGNRKQGGYENEVQANGDGTARIIKTRVPWSLELQLSIDDDNGDLEFLQDLANGRDFFPFSYTEAGGGEWGGQAQITGEVARAASSATATVTFMGPGELLRQ